MSIYFMHLFLEFFLLSFFSAFYSKNLSVLKISISVFLGLIFAYISFYIFNYEKQNILALNIANFGLVLTLILSFGIIIFRPFAYFVSFLLSLFIFLKYLLKSSAFVIFESSLLDTQGIFNFGFILLAIFICFVFYITFLFAVNKISSKYTYVFAFIFALCLINESCAELVLYGLRKGIFNTFSDELSGLLLSYVAKSKYYVEFYPYVYLILGVVYICLLLKLRVLDNKKKTDFDIGYRINNATNSSINKIFTVHFVSSVFALCIVLFYDLVASKPISIDEPTIISPTNEKYFEFNLKEVSDGKLHRYAYISETGKKIRFFIINRFSGKITPVAVFDSCMICGDLGYIQKNDELICVACNVRIFLPSVGKAGGCNPIPLNYEVDEENNKLLIKISDVKDGENYFSEIVEITVTDPVNKKTFLNTEAKQSYLYNGINYYFSSDDSYIEFKNNPTKFVSAKSAPYRLDAYKN